MNPIGRQMLENNSNGATISLPHIISLSFPNAGKKIRTEITRYPFKILEIFINLDFWILWQESRRVEFSCSKFSFIFLSFNHFDSTFFIFVVIFSFIFLCITLVFTSGHFQL